jgi:hypothetical protein
MRFWRRRFIRWSALAFAIAAFAAPVAGAQVYAEGGGSSGTSNATTTPPPAKPATPAVAPAPVGEFSWGDAGIGAAGAMSIVLLASGLLLVARGTRGVAVDA